MSPGLDTFSWQSAEDFVVIWYNHTKQLYIWGSVFFGNNGAIWNKGLFCKIAYLIVFTLLLKINGKSKMETILWFKMSAYIRNASEQLCFFCKSCRLPGCDRSCHWKDFMHFKVRPFILSWDNEVIIHWTTVLLKWVSYLKLLHHDVHTVWWRGFFL